MFLSLDIHSILYRISVSIVLLLLSLVESSVHYINVQCIILGGLLIYKTLLVLSMDLIAFMLFCTAASVCKIDPMLKMDI